MPNENSDEQNTHQIFNENSDEQNNFTRYLMKILMKQYFLLTQNIYS
jgi:hypothetical protein